MWNDLMIATSLKLPKESVAYVPEDRLAEFGPIEIHQIQPASLDVRLASEFIRHPDGQRFGTDARYPYILSPGECVLTCIVERVRLPDNLVARIEGKSSWARRFLTVHSAGFIDPGFHGDVTLELKNDSWEKIHLVPGQRIAQISFQNLAAPAIRPYGTEGLLSHYQGQKGPTKPC